MLSFSLTCPHIVEFGVRVEELEAENYALQIQKDKLRTQNEMLKQKLEDLGVAQVSSSGLV